jgi:hypothetical protein
MIRAARRLGLTGNQGLAAPRMIQALMRNACEMIHLDLGDTGLTDESVAALAGTPQFARLEALALDENALLTPACLSHLRAATSLRSLSLGWCDTRAQGRARALLEAFLEVAPPTLTQLSTGVDLDPELCTALEKRFTLRRSR